MCLCLQFWLKFAPVLNSGKAWRRRLLEAERGGAAAAAAAAAGGAAAAAADLLQGLNAEEQQAAENLIEEERRKRSHLVVKYLQGLQTREKEEKKFRAALRAQLEELRDELFAASEAVAAATSRRAAAAAAAAHCSKWLLRDTIDRAKTAVSSMQSFVCCALELPGAAAAATGDVPPYTAAQKQLKLVKAMLQHGADNK
ncbi:hypothetical protein ETH_00022230, partial [Eimeria tenella]